MILKIEIKKPKISEDSINNSNANTNYSNTKNESSDFSPLSLYSPI